MGPQKIFVTNTNDFVHTDRYDGEDFVFPPHEQVLVPVEAAEHMFGFNNPDKSAILQRLGWAMTYDPATKAYTENPDGVRRLAGFVREEAVMVSRSSLLPLDEPAIA